MIRMIAKNERLNGRVEECEKLFTQRNVSRMGVLADKNFPKAPGSKPASEWKDVCCSCEGEG